MPVEQLRPDVLAMILADSVLQEPLTGKYFLQGTYSIIFANDFPLVHPALMVYVAVTNGHGRTPIKLRLINVDETREPILEIDATLDFPDPLHVVEGVLGTRAVRFPEPAGV